MFTIFKKEFNTFFLGYTAYISAIVFSIVCSLFLWFFNQDYNIFNSGIASLNSFFFITPWIFMFLIPSLTMKSIAEEQANGTLIWLFTQPIKISEIVLGKFFAVFVLIIFLLIFSLIYVYSITQIVSPEQSIDFGIIKSGYFGLILLGSLFASIGIFASSISKNQVLAFVISVFINFIIFYGFQSLASYNLMGNADYYVQKLGAFSNYNQFLKGIVDTRAVLYFVAVSGIFLTVCMQLLYRKKTA